MSAPACRAVATQPALRGASASVVGLRGGRGVGRVAFVLRGPTVAHRERTADVDERGKERAKKAGLAFLGDDDEAQAEDARQNTL